MRKLQRFTMAVVLTFMLAAFVFAGDILTGYAPPPPPASSSAAAPGDIYIPGQTDTPLARSDSVTEVALNLLMSVLAVF